MTPEPDLDTLFAAHLEGRLEAHQKRALNDRLRADAQARRQFAELLNLDAALASAAAAWTAPVRTPAPSRPRRPWRRVALAAAALIALAFTVLTPRAPHATVVRSAGAAYTVGQPLTRGVQELAQGSVEFLTRRGAHVVIEAPARFEFESPQRLRLLRGRAAADVPPPAKGFTILTPTGKAVDLGTQFGVDVPPGGEAQIHVFQGEVIAHAAGGARRSLRDGEALALQATQGSARELRSAAFIRPEEMAELSAALAAGQRARSEAALAALRRDPALIALLDFEDNRPQEGNFRIVQGRWPGSHAPEFTELGDHLKLDAGGGRDWPQLTLAAWVRLDRLGAPYQSLLHTDGWEASKPGQVHWMVTRHATMRLALRGNTLAAGSDETEGSPDSRTPVLPELGRWLHLATVYDAQTRSVRFYLNGRFDKETRQELAHPASLGPARIGNWDRQDRKLSGRVDELLLLGRALSDAEIGALFEAGNPYR